MAQKKQIQALSFVALLAIMLVLMGQVFLPYMTVLLWSSVAYILISPVHAWLLSRLNRKNRFYETWRHFLAGIFAVGTVMLLAGVAVFLGFQLVGQGRIFIEGAQKFLEENPYFFRNEGWGRRVSEIVQELSLGTVDLSALDLKAEVISFLSKYANTIMSYSQEIVKDVGNFVLSLAFICFALYFFYIDAPYLARMFVKAIPIDERNTKHLLAKFRDVTKNLFMGFFLVAFYQAIMAFIIFSIFGIQGSLLFAVLILFSSFVPMFGCALIWAPLGVSVFISRGLPTSILFVALCAFFISFIDNFLRPFFLKDRIKIHPLLIFFSIIGGLKVFGFNGVLLGPLVVILFFTIVEIALEEDGVNPGSDFLSQ